MAEWTSQREELLSVPNNRTLHCGAEWTQFARESVGCAFYIESLPARSDVCTRGTGVMRHVRHVTPCHPVLACIVGWRPRAFGWLFDGLILE